MTIEQKASGYSQRICQYKICSSAFMPKMHNQKYCTSICTRAEMNRDAMESYYRKKDIKSGALRLCDHLDCDTKLSRYNFNDVCSVHERIAPLFDKNLLAEFG